MNKKKSLDGDNLSIRDIADVEGLYRLEGQILPPTLMMMLNSCRQKYNPAKITNLKSIENVSQTINFTYKILVQKSLTAIYNP